MKISRYIISKQVRNKKINRKHWNVRCIIHSGEILNTYTYTYIYILNVVVLFKNVTAVNPQKERIDKISHTIKSILLVALQSKLTLKFIVSFGYILGLIYVVILARILQIRLTHVFFRFLYFLYYFSFWNLLFPFWS